MAKKNRSRRQFTRPADIIEMAGNLLQIGGIRAFVLYQVIEALRLLQNEEVREMSRAVAPFERMGRERRFIQDINHELSGGKWRADFHKEADQEAV